MFANRQSLRYISGETILRKYVMKEESRTILTLKGLVLYPRFSLQINFMPDVSSNPNEAYETAEAPRHTTGLLLPVSPHSLWTSNSSDSNFCSYITAVWPLSTSLYATFCFLFPPVQWKSFPEKKWTVINSHFFLTCHRRLQKKKIITDSS